MFGQYIHTIDCTTKEQLCHAAYTRRSHAEDSHTQKEDNRGEHGGGAAVEKEAEED